MSRQVARDNTVNTKRITGCLVSGILLLAVASWARDLSVVGVKYELFRKAAEQTQAT